MIGVYKITNKVTGDFYIGASVNIHRRKIQHFAPKRFGHSKRFDEDIDKYGAENFEFEVIEECSLDVLREQELHYIITLKPTYNRNWKGCSFDDDVRSKVSDGTKKWWQNMPSELQARLKKNLTGPKIGHEVSVETREKISRKLRGIKQPAELIEKRRQGILARHRQIPQLNLGHRKKVFADNIEFESVKACAEYFCVTAASVTHALKKGHKVKGCVVRFVV